jgi:hypothetical protein
MTKPVGHHSGDTHPAGKADGHSAKPQSDKPHSGNAGGEFNRRKFERLELTEAAYAVDAVGRELGKVTQASGGGMMIKPKSADIAKSLPQGERVTITVMEPTSQTQHTLDMVVRYSSPEHIGLEFVSGK